MLQKVLRQCLKLASVRFEKPPGPVIHALHHLSRFVVNTARCRFTARFGSLLTRVQKHGLPSMFHRIRPQVFAHAELRNHSPRHLAGPLQIVLRTGGRVTEHDFFSSPPAEHHGNTVQEFILGIQITILRWQLLGISQSGDAMRNDGYFAHRVGARERLGHQCVTRFMVGDPLLLSRRHDATFLFRPSHDAVNRLVKFIHGHRVPVVTRSEKSGLIDHTGQVGTNHSRCPSSNHLKINVSSQPHLLSVQAEDIKTAL